MDNATFVCNVLEISNDNDRRLRLSLQIPKQLNSLSRRRNSITLNYVYCNLCGEGFGEIKLRVGFVPKILKPCLNAIVGQLTTIFLASKFHLNAACLVGWK